MDTYCLGRVSIISLKKEGRRGQTYFGPIFRRRLGREREIRFPDAGEDERGVPMETSRSCGGLKALMGAYHKYLIITELLGPVH